MVKLYKLDIEEVLEEKSDVWQDLYAAYQNQTILQAELFGVEEYHIGEQKVYALVAYFDNDIKGIIPQNESGILNYPLDEEGNKKLKLSRREFTLVRKQLLSLAGHIEPVHVTEIHKEENLVVLSREKALERLSEITWNKLAKDKTVIAKVRRVLPKQITVEIGGINVNMPIDELSWGFINDARTYVGEHDKIPVKIKEINKKEKKLVVSHKECKPNPWPSCTKRYIKSNIYLATVTGVIDQAVFANLEPGVDVYCQHMKFERVKKGDKVFVRIDGVDITSKRMWGSLTGIADDKTPQIDVR